MNTSIIDIGYKYGNSTVVAPAPPGNSGRKRFYVQCDCGYVRMVMAAAIKRKRPSMCRSCSTKAQTQTVYTILERLVICEPVALSTGCWEYHTYSNSGGYGQTALKHKKTLTHRAVYEHFCGAIPDGYDLHHICENKICCNFEHLEPVPKQLHYLKGYSITKINAEKTHCIRGHPLSGDNLHIVHKSNGKTQRLCRICMRLAHKRYRERNVEKVRAKCLRYYYARRELANKTNQG